MDADTAKNIAEIGKGINPAQLTARNQTVCACQAAIGPPGRCWVRSEGSLKRWHVEQGWQGASGLALFARQGGGRQRSAFETLADSARVEQAKVTQQRLRGVLEAIGREPCFREYMTFDIAGNGFGISFRLPGLPWHLFQSFRERWTSIRKRHCSL